MKRGDFIASALWLAVSLLGILAGLVMLAARALG